MPLAEKHIVSEHDDIVARRLLAKAIEAHQAKLAELSSMRETIKEAELKLASMQAAIDKSAHVEDALADCAADALRRGTEISERSPAWRAKQKRDELIADRALLATGFARLQAKASSSYFPPLARASFI